VVTIAFVVNKFGKKVLVIYLASIVVLALVFGILLDSLLAGVTVKEMLFKGREIPFALQVFSVLLFVGLVIRGFFKKKSESTSKMRYTFHVPDMNCKHCQSAVEKALKGIPGVKSVEISLDQRLVKVDGEVDQKTITKQIEKAGFNPTKAGGEVCSI
jgi:copper chaperone CopZ